MPRELGGSLAPISPRGALIKIHFDERTCKFSTYIHAHISCSYVMKHSEHCNVNVGQNSFEERF